MKLFFSEGTIGTRRKTFIQFQGSHLEALEINHFVFKSKKNSFDFVKSSFSDSDCTFIVFEKFNVTWFCITLRIIGGSRNMNAGPGFLLVCGFLFSGN